MTRRTSARGAAAQKRYTVDAFEGIEELQDDISDHSPVRHSRDSDSADEFHVEAEPADAADEDEDEDELSGMDGEVEAEDPASDAGEQDLDDAMSIAGDEDLEDDDDDEKPANRTGPRKPRVPLAGPEGLLFARGLPESVTRKSGKHDKRLFLFGSSVTDFENIEKACYKWDGQDALPVRRKPQNPVASNFEYSYWQGSDARKREEDSSWKWYFEHGGKESFKKRQNFVKMSSEEGRDRLTASEAPERSFVAGPPSASKLYKLPIGQSVSLKQIWEQSSEAEGAKPSKNSAVNKAGFVLHLGDRVNCVEWASNQQGSSQYLAASTSPERPVPKGTAPAYTPQGPFASHVQIWEFTAHENGSLDSDIAPVLKYALCTEWGDVKALKWCPAPYKSSASTKGSIGLLAGVWGDGGLRVIDLMDQPKTSTTNYIRIEKAAFETHPPDTLFTNLTWTSATRIAAGCANGCIAIFDLDKAASSNIPRPTSYTSIASGYILSISCCYPSHQNLLLTTSTDGYPRLTDLNEPDPASPSATVQAPRSRTTQDIIAWVEFCQTAVVMDDNFALKGLPLRRFFTTVALGRAKSVGTAIATSPCHPFVLMGTAHGEVTGLNPMRRIIQPKVLTLLQSWFAHEWRRPTAAEAAGEETGPDAVGPRGLSRFTEGYKIEQGQRTYREGSMQNSSDKDHGLHFHTIHELETGVSSLAWNPNRECGSWVAAGLADGLVRVEDLAAA
ncbi:hypothetical protein Q7P37_004850 [Cladosporium fusiforme]